MRNLIFLIVAILVISSLSLAQGNWNLELVGDLFFSGSFSDATVQEDYLYATNGYGLMIYDVDNPDSIYSIGRLPTDGFNNYLCIDDSLVFVIDYGYYVSDSSELLIIDSSDPSSPTVISSLEFSDGSEHIVKDNNYLYALIGNTLNIININNIQTPFIEGSLILSSQYYYLDGLAVEGQFVYTSVYLSGSNRFKTIDVSNASSPQMVGECEIPGKGDICIKDNIAFVACGSSGLAIVDISTPNNPTLINTITNISPYNMANNQNTLFVESSNTLFIYNISSPSNPVLISSIGINSGCQILTASENELFAFYWNGSFTAYDITIPSSVSVISGNTFISKIFSVAVYNNYAYVGDYPEGKLWKIQIYNPANPVIVDSCQTSGTQIWHIKISNDKAYLTTRLEEEESFFEIVNLNNCELIGSCSIPYNWNTPIAISDTLVYLAVGDSGISIIDISNSSNPNIINNIQGYSFDVYFNNDYLFVASYPLRIYSVSNPLSPVLISEIYLFIYEDA